MSPLQDPAEPCRAERAMSRLERSFERVLWLSRMLVLIAVLAALLVAVVMFVFATTDVVRLVTALPSAFTATDAEMVQKRLETVAKVVKVVDLYLVATFMLIFSMGLYELFIGKIEVAEQSEVARRLLVIRDLDDLKDRLAKIVLLIMAMLFLEHALRLQPREPIDLLYLGVGVVLISLSLFLTQKKSAPGKPKEGQE